MNFPNWVVFRSEKIIAKKLRKYYYKKRQDSNK